MQSDDLLAESGSPESSPPGGGDNPVSVGSCKQASKRLIGELRPYTAAPEMPKLANRERSLPLSFSQLRLWFLTQMEGTSQAYHMTLNVRLVGALDSRALRRALDRVVTRHEVLRTTFEVVDGQPLQRVASDEAGFKLREHDLRGHANAATEIERLAAEEAQSLFNLKWGPLIRGRLIRYEENDHLLLVTAHHVVTDGWSMGLLVKEVSALYSAYLRGEEDPLPPLPLQYADYAVWQREWIAGGALREQEEYWKGNLAGAPELLEVPADHVRPAEQNYAGEFLGIELDEALTAGLKELSRRHGTTLFMTLLAGWGALLGRLSGQQDVVIGTPVANRGRREIEGLIGFFINTLALRMDLGGSPTVGELLERVKAQALAAQEHQDIPFEQVVELVRPVRSLSHSPLFQVMFAWQNAPGWRLELPGLAAVPQVESPLRIAKFDLTLFMREAGGRIRGGIEYATSLFERATVERYLGYFQTLLEGMVRREDAAMDQLPLLSLLERRRVLYEWNATGQEIASEACIHELIAEQSEKRPDAVAVVTADGVLTYACLERRANQLGRYLRGQGVQPDTRVAICVQRGLEMVVGLLGVLKAGGAYVPLDPSYPAERLQDIMSDSRPAALLVCGGRPGWLLDGTVPVLDLGDAEAAWRSSEWRGLDSGAVGLSGDHLAYVIYTSGSTGRPKGVMVPHVGLSHYVRWAAGAYGVGQGVVSSSISFDATVTSLYTPLVCGGTVRVVGDGEELDGLYAAVQEGGCGLVKATPSHLSVLGHRLRGGPGGSHCELLVVGGEALPAGVVELWRELDPQVRIVNEYGPTETVVGCVVHEVAGSFEGGRLVPIGRPIANTQIYILDGFREPVPVGVVGELYIGGRQVTRGYLERAGLTAERYGSDPYGANAGGRLYRTGDLARWREDGTIEYLGRNDFQVKIRGYRIELEEIEWRLGRHAGVSEVVVVAQGSGEDQRLVAYYATVAASQQAMGAEPLRSYLAESLPAYMVPAAFVRLPSLPRTVNGKIDRNALPLPDASAYSSPAYQAPIGEIETMLAAIWTELLKVERVGRLDNFFELGGHSLLAIPLVNGIRTTWGVELAIRAIVVSPCLMQLAALVEDMILDQVEQIPEHEAIALTRS